MSSIAVPTPIDGRAQLVAFVRTALGAAILTALLVTLTPFEIVPTNAAGSGNAVNQIGYALLAGLALVGHLVFTDARTALSLLRPTWVLMLLWLAVTTVQAIHVEDAARAYAFTLAGMIAATGALCLPPNVRSFRLCLTIAGGTVLLLSYVGVFLMPEVGVHSAFGAEGHHAGLWRGLYSHKNVAGAVMTAIFFVGIYLLRSRWWVAGGAITLLSLIFVLQTGSRTAALLLPAIAILVIGARLVGGRPLAALGVAGVVGLLAVVTLGLTYSQAMNDFLGQFMPDTSLTGRTFLWLFAIDLWEHRAWTGFGLDSFWRAATVLASEPSRELAWDPRGAANGHSGYLDLAIVSGIPGLILGLLVLVFLPLADYLRTGRDKESARLADLFLMILAFLLANAFLESFFFERASPIWMTVWIAVVGLRLAARNRLETD